jgi:hypothetical protein
MPPAPPAAPAQAQAQVQAPERGIVQARKDMREGKNINEIIGGYGKPINPYGLTREEQGQLIEESKVSSTPPQTPNSPPYRPSSPLRGGTRSLKKKTQITRRVKKTVEHLAKAFSKVWAKLKK